jgi:hypothetical protein
LGIGEKGLLEHGYKALFFPFCICFRSESE